MTFLAREHIFDATEMMTFFAHVHIFDATENWGGLGWGGVGLMTFLAHEHIFDPTEMMTFLAHEHIFVATEMMTFLELVRLKWEKSFSALSKAAETHFG